MRFVKVTYACECGNTTHWTILALIHKLMNWNHNIEQTIEES